MSLPTRSTVSRLLSRLAPLAGCYASLAHLRDPRVALLAVAHLLDLASGSIVVPLLPSYAATYGAGPVELGVLFALPTAAQALLSTPAGALADRVGRRPLIVAGIATGGVVVAGLAVADSLPALFALRAADGVAAAAAGPAASAYLGDLADEDDRAGVLGAYRSAGMVGVALGPAAGGLLAAVAGPSTPFLALGVATLVGGVALAVELPATDDRPSGPSSWSLPSPSLRSLRAYLSRSSLPAPPSPAAVRDRTTLPMALLLCSAFLGNAGTGALNPTLAPLLSTTIDAGPAYVGTVYSALGATMAVAMPVGGTLGDRLPRVPLLVATKLAWAGVVAGVALASVRALPVALYAVGGLASALAAPATGALNYEVAPEGDRSTFLGAVGTAFSLGGAVGPLAGGALAAAVGPRATFLVVAGLWLANAVLLVPIRNA